MLKQFLKVIIISDIVKYKYWKYLNNRLEKNVILNAETLIGRYQIKRYNIVCFGHRPRLRMYLLTTNHTIINFIVRLQNKIF